MAKLAATTRVKNRAHAYATRILRNGVNGMVWILVYEAYLEGYRQAAREARLLLAEAETDLEHAIYQQTPALLRKQAG